MQLRLLGPFEMVTDTGPVKLAGRGERALVAVLALSPRRLVADTMFIEQLWSDGEQPVDPVTPCRPGCRSCVGRLAGAGCEQLLARQGGGYRLDVDPACVDAHRFASLIDLARRAGGAEERSTGMTRP